MLRLVSYASCVARPINRQGTFTSDSAKVITARWEGLAEQERIRFAKVSWVPDHVHVAFRSHPSVVPAKIACLLLNASQEVLLERFDALAIRTGNPRIWKPGAYIGTYGDLANSQIQAYLDSWRKQK